MQRTKVLLWPLGGTLLGLLVVPIAIEQYPEIFKESRWILPVSAGAVAACWVVPFLFHERVRRSWNWTRRRFGTVVAIAVTVAATVLCGVGVRELYRFHVRHLEARLSNLGDKRPSLSDGPSAGGPPSSAGDKTEIPTPGGNLPDTEAKLPRSHGTSSTQVTALAGAEDPELRLLKDGVQASGECATFQQKAQSIYDDAKAQIKMHDTLPNRSDRAGFVKWAIDGANQSIVKLYGQAYRDEFQSVGTQLIRKTPELAEPDVNFTDPQSMMGILQICRELSDLTATYADQQCIDGKITGTEEWVYQNKVKAVYMPKCPAARAIMNGAARVPLTTPQRPTEQLPPTNKVDCGNAVNCAGTNSGIQQVNLYGAPQAPPAITHLATSLELLGWVLWMLIDKKSLGPCGIQD
jgi:hypothetical protein